MKMSEKHGIKRTWEEVNTNDTFDSNRDDAIVDNSEKPSTIHDDISKKEALNGNCEVLIVDNPAESLTNNATNNGKEININSSEPHCESELNDLPLKATEINPFVNPKYRNVYCMPVAPRTKTDDEIFTKKNKHIFNGRCPCCE